MDTPRAARQTVDQEDAARLLTWLLVGVLKSQRPRAARHDGVFPARLAFPPEVPERADEHAGRFVPARGEFRGQEAADAGEEGVGRERIAARFFPEP